MSVSADTFVAELRTWVGTPWRHQGRTKGRGVDCIGLIVAAARDAGVMADASEFDRVDYLRHPRGDELREVLERYCTPAATAAPGVLVLFRLGAKLRHVAVVAGETMIHADSATGHVVEVGYRGPWLRRTDSLWQLPEIAYE